MRRTIPAVSIELDAGVFDYLWRVVEARYAKDHGHSVVEHADLLRRAVEQFRAAAGTLGDGEQRKAQPVKRKLKKK